MKKKSVQVDFPVYGQSPLGYNGKEGTATGFAEIRSSAILDVPLVLDTRTNTWISKLAKIEQEDKAEDRRKEQIFREEEAFRQKAGFTQ